MDIMIKSTLGNMIVNPDVIRIIKDAGYYVIDDKTVNDLYLSEWELAKLKLRIYNGELVEVNNGKIN